MPQESSESNLWTSASLCVSSLTFSIFVDTRRCLKGDLKGTWNVLRSVCLCYKVTSLFPMFKLYLGKHSTLCFVSWEKPPAPYFLCSEFNTVHCFVCKRRVLVMCPENQCISCDLDELCPVPSENIFKVRVLIVHLLTKDFLVFRPHRIMMWTGLQGMDPPAWQLWKKPYFSTGY